MPDPRRTQPPAEADVEGTTDFDQAIKEAMRRRGEKHRASTPDAGAMAAFLKQRIKGQDHVIDDMVPFIVSRWTMNPEDRKTPIANFLFVGPPGTGKTELASLLAEYLYRDRNNILLFDCGEFVTQESVTGLVGVPRGYVGWEEGGRLTRPVLNNPRRVILFDEIEKAHAKVSDVFLGMMGQARVTEQGTGNQADFSHAIVILTSNAEQEELAKLQQEVDDPRDLMVQAKKRLKERKAFRPELLSRIDKVYLFRPLQLADLTRIALLKIHALAKSYNLQIAWIDPGLVGEVVDNARDEPGARVLEREALALLSDVLIRARDRGLKRVRLTRDEYDVLDVFPVE